MPRIPYAFLLLSVTLMAMAPFRPPLTREAFVGVWEAVVQDGSMASGVYQMLVPEKGDVRLIQLFANDKSTFFGTATSYELADAKIKIRFVVDPEHVPFYDWIEVQGIAAGGDGSGAIVGKIVKGKGKDELSEPVFFKKGRWVQDFDTASKEAEKILRGPTMENGRAVRRSP